MDGTDVQSEPPRAIIHQRILDAARSHPNASVEKLADEISGAPVALVERVLDQYGDPAELEAGQTDDQKKDKIDENDTEASVDDDDSEPEEFPELQSLSEKVRRTLREVYETPEAPQEDIAQRLGVTGAAISNRLSKVDGFDWSDRKEFVNRLFGPRLIANGSGRSLNGLSELEERVSELERSASAESETGTLAGKPELAHKVIRVCIASDDFTEQEELELIRAIIG